MSKIIFKCGVNSLNSRQFTPHYSLLTKHTLHKILTNFFLLYSFNQLDLPGYETYDKLRSYLLKAIHECSEGFGFA